MKKKILVVYGTAGIGHKKAALAVKAALDELKPDGVEASIIDSLDYTNEFFKWAYLASYLLMVNKLPTFWGLSYYITDNPFVDLVVSKVRRVNNWLNSKKLREYLLQSQPDVIVSTHFFAGEVIADLKKRGLLRSKLITVVTDYRPHAWWIVDPTDMYVVASDDAEQDLLRRGTAQNKIKILGIPVEPVFSKSIGRKEALAKLGLKDGIFTILVILGGFGVGPIGDIVKTIQRLSTPVRLVAVCGHNDALVKKLEGMKAGSPGELKVLGFINNVYDYMEAADLFISKPGGISSTEAMAKELPMIVVFPIIGQETRNSDFLVRHGAAVKIDNMAELKDAAGALVSDPKRLEAMRENIRKIRKPFACYDIAKMAAEMCK